MEGAEAGTALHWRPESRSLSSPEEEDQPMAGDPTRLHNKEERNISYSVLAIVSHDMVSARLPQSTRRRPRFPIPTPAPGVRNWSFY